MTAGTTRLVSLLCLCLSSPVGHACGQLQVRKPWIREPVPGATVAAGYLELINPSAESIEITSVESTCCGGTSLHRTVVAGDRVSMVGEPSITVPAHGQTTLAPGGAHLMLMDPKITLLAGGRIELNIHCASGSPVTATAVVRRD